MAELHPDVAQLKAQIKAHMKADEASAGEVALMGAAMQIASTILTDLGRIATALEALAASKKDSAP
jgi:hypothetical protein